MSSRQLFHDRRDVLRLLILLGDTGDVVETQEFLIQIIFVIHTTKFNAISHLHFFEYIYDINLTYRYLKKREK